MLAAIDLDQRKVVGVGETVLKAIREAKKKDLEGNFTYAGPGAFICLQAQVMAGSQS